MLFKSGGKFSFRFPDVAFRASNLGHESDLSGLGLLVSETNCRWYGVALSNGSYWTTERSIRHRASGLDTVWEDIINRSRGGAYNDGNFIVMYCMVCYMLNDLLHVT